MLYDLDQNAVDIDGIAAHKFRRSEDVLAHFQSRLDRFPRDVSRGAFRFCELAAYLIRPAGQDLNQLSHILFPNSILLVPDTDISLQYHSSTAVPQITLMADAESGDLYVNITCFRRTEDDHMERRSLVVPAAKASFLDDPWLGLEESDKRILEADGFRPGMSAREWGDAIITSSIASRPALMPTVDLRLCRFRELPIPMNTKGIVGTSGTYHYMPDFVLSAVANNGFFYDEELHVEDETERLFEIGDVHLHPLDNEMDPLQRQVADIVGADVVRRHPSVPDIYSRRSSRTVFKALCEFYGRPIRKTMTSFAGIIAVDGKGCVQGARYFDFYNTDMKYLADLNERVYQSMFRSGNPDPHLIAEHYKYMESVCTDDFGNGTESDHVGDPNYEPRQGN